MKLAAAAVAEIRASAKRYIDPGGQPYSLLSLNDTIRISGQNRVPGLSIEIRALELGIVPARYVRNLGTIGVEGQIKLLRSCVAVAGAGGLGGIIIEVLARAGVGHLVIIDCGRFTGSNLNRQALCKESLIGKSKAKAAVSRIREINSSIEVTASASRIDNKNVVKLVKGANVVIDALDNLPSRYLLADACRKLRIPLVHGAIAGYSGQVMTILPGDKGLSSVYGPLDKGQIYGIEAITGNPPSTAAVTGALQANEAIKLITGTGNSIRHQLMMLDLADNSTEHIGL
jgi:molybdopterin/thiamine biosynthesis adenylyltransferase